MTDDERVKRIVATVGDMRPAPGAFQTGGAARLSICCNADDQAFKVSLKRVPKLGISGRSFGTRKRHGVSNIHFHIKPHAERNLVRNSGIPEKR